MGRHAEVQAGAPGEEAVLLGLVDALDQAHELVLDVAVVVGGAEPARWIKI